jgi:hypothetical protein
MKTPLPDEARNPLSRHSVEIYTTLMGSSYLGARL